MENTQNTIPVEQQEEAIQLVASGKPAPRTKNPKRVAAGKKTCRAQQTKERRGKLYLFATIFYPKPCIGRNTTIDSIHCIFE